MSFIVPLLAEKEHHSQHFTKQMEKNYRFVAINLLVLKRFISQNDIDPIVLVQKRSCSFLSFQILEAKNKTMDNRPKKTIWI